MSNSDADYTSKGTGKSYALVTAPRYCQGCAFSEEGESKKAEAQRQRDCLAAPACCFQNVAKVYKEITE